MLAAVLDVASRPLFEQAVGALESKRDLSRQIREALDGTEPLHGVLLAGSSGGKLGYVWSEYRIVDGAIQLNQVEHFGGSRNIHTTRGQYFGRLAQDPAIFTDPAVAVVKRFLLTARRACPTIGGPDQIVAISDLGLHWISRPPVTAADSECVSVLASEFTGCTLRLNRNTITTVINNDVSGSDVMGLRITNLGGNDVQVSQNGMKILVSSSQLLTANVQVQGGGGGYMGVLAVQSQSGYSTVIDGDGYIKINGVQVLRERQTLPSNDVAGIISVLRTHGLIF